MNYNDRMLELMRRRGQLVAQCDMQRADVAAIARRSKRVFSVADRVLGVVGYFRAHPLVLGAAVIALVVVRRRGLWGWLGRGFAWWRIYRSLRASLFAFKL